MRHALLSFALAACGSAAAAQITVYKDQAFQGESLVVRDAAHDLSQSNFHDQISSIVIESGTWEVCTQPKYRGDCVVLEPGRYATLHGRINHRIESVREAPLYAVRAQRDSAAARANAPALVVFSAERFLGASHGVHKDVRALTESGFTVPPASLVVHEGIWQACTEPGYQGHCRVFRPGRYRDLPSMGASIVSLRRLGAEE